MKKINEESVIKICFFLALAVLIVGCDIHAGRFLLETMEDGGGPALFLIGFGIICAVFYTWMAINSTNATRRTVALVCKLIVMATMLVCAFAINSYKREAKAQTNQKADKIVESQAEIDLEKQRLEIEKQRLALRQQESQQLVSTVVDVKKRTGSTKLADGVLAASAAKDAAPTPTPTATDKPDAIKIAASLDRSGTDYKKEITHWFADFARGPITWFPGAIHGITFGIMVIFVVLTIGGTNEVQQSQPVPSVQPVQPVQPAGAAGFTAMPSPPTATAQEPNRVSGFGQPLPGAARSRRSGYVPSQTPAPPPGTSSAQQASPEATPGNFPQPRQ